MLIKVKTNHDSRIINYYSIFSLIFGVWIAFQKDGQIQVGGELLDNDSVMGNLNFFKSVEGFIESLPQSTYQLSIIMRTPWEEISKNYLQDM